MCNFIINRFQDGVTVSGMPRMSPSNGSESNSYLHRAAPHGLEVETSSVREGFGELQAHGLVNRLFLGVHLLPTNDIDAIQPGCLNDACEDLPRSPTAMTRPPPLLSKLDLKSATAYSTN